MACGSTATQLFVREEGRVDLLEISCHCESLIQSWFIALCSARYRESRNVTVEVKCVPGDNSFASCKQGGTQLFCVCSLALLATDLKQDPAFLL